MYSLKCDIENQKKEKRNQIILDILNLFTLRLQT